MEFLLGDEVYFAGFDLGGVWCADSDCHDDEDGGCDDEAEVKERVEVFHDGWLSMV